MTPSHADELQTPVRHETFTIRREIAADPAEVFAAFADPSTRQRWFRLPGSKSEYEHDFRIGGGEVATSTFTHLEGSSEQLEYRSRYLHIVESRLIVFAYQSVVDGDLRWTSLVTVSIDGQDSETVLTWTEQVAFVKPSGDGSADLPHLRTGTTLRLNGLQGAIEDSRRTGNHGTRRTVHPFTGQRDATTPIA